MLAKIIGAPANTLPTFGHSKQSGRPYIEVDSAGYHFLVAEHGQKFERHTTFDNDELLYRIFQSVTFQLAYNCEVTHRINGQDPRRIMFEYQEELLSKLPANWGERRTREHAHILQNHPFNGI